jgi:GNAT superfamily N-acetyltransferase
MTTSYLNKEEYLTSVLQMTNISTLQFAKAAMEWWDNYYSWKNFPCMVLQDDHQDVAYLFYHISKDKQYLTIHNIFTHHDQRQQGYATKLLQILYSQLTQTHSIQRTKMHCVDSSLSFYMKLGVKFWGVNDIGQFYANFKMPTKSINELPQINQNERLDELSNSEILQIWEAHKANGSEFDPQRLNRFNNSLELLGESYQFDRLGEIVTR